MLKVPALHFAIDDPRADDVAPLICELDGYLAELHPSGNIRPVTVDELQQPNVTFITARVDGTPVACGAFVRHDDYVEVKRMYVLPACRGLGLGKQLLEALEARIADNAPSVSPETPVADALELMDEHDAVFYP